MIEKIPYTIRQSKRARHVRISVNCDAVVSVTQPVGVPLWKIEAFVSEKADWISRKIAFFKRVAKSSHALHGDYKIQKEAARVLIGSRIPELNRFYGFHVGRISIRNQKTRWGSCSRKGTLSFNYRIVNLAPELADYIVVHELCHLAELNHSKKFWALVARVFPNHVALRKALRNEFLT